MENIDVSKFKTLALIVTAAFGMVLGALEEAPLTGRALHIRRPIYELALRLLRVWLRDVLPRMSDSVNAAVIKAECAVGAHANCRHVTSCSCYCHGGLQRHVGDTR